MSVFKDFPGLENLEKKFKDFQGPTRALQSLVTISDWKFHDLVFLESESCCCRSDYCEQL